MIAYVLGVLILFGILGGMAMLPDQVAMQYVKGQLANFVSRETAVAAHAVMGFGFTALFWRWPRELVWLAAAVLSVVLTYFVLYLNVVMV